MFKWLGYLFLLGILLVAGLGIFAYCSLTATQPPGIEDAPYALQAYYEHGDLKFPTRIYYAESIEFEGGVAILTNYWTYNGEKYKKHNGERKVEPPYSIVRRSR
jgi:hypothetical protein